MYIQPNSTIKLYRNVPLDTTYEHTLWFDNVSSQNNYFHGTNEILVQTLNNNTYQRVNKGSMRIGINADAIYNCNYLAFQNTNYGSKWFYAFITSVEYVNNGACEVTFEIDVMQTYLFDVDLKQCFVEREHSSTDSVGDNVVPEQLDPEYYIASNVGLDDHDKNTIKSLKAYSLVIASGYNLSAKTVSPIFIRGGLIGGVDYYHYDLLLEDGTIDAVALQDATDDLNSLVDAGQTDAIINMFMFPTALLNKTGYADAGVLSISLSNFSNDKWSSIGMSGYYPRNKKCYTFPYNSLYVGDYNGESSMLLKPELISYSTSVLIGGAFTSVPSAVVYPAYYQGENYNVMEGYSVTRFPQVPFTTDSYRAYIAQGGLTQDYLSFLSSAVSFGGSIAGAGNTSSSTPYATTQNLLQNAIGTASSLSNLAYKLNMPKATHGNSTADAVTALHYPFVHITQRHANMSAIKRIDSFFDKYGYATNEVKVPNRNVRKQWCYTKTIGCVVFGNAPSDDVHKICEIYDKGITFWKNAWNVGNYSLDNSIG